MTLVVPNPFSAGDEPTAANMQTLTDAITQLQGGTPTAGGILDFAALRQTVVQAIPTSTWTALTWDTFDIDTADGWVSGSPYTAVQPGWYECKATAAYSANGTGNRAVRFAVNGTYVPASQTDSGALTALGGSFSTFATVYLATGDYVETETWQNSGGSLNTIVSGPAASRMVVKWAHS